MLTGSSGDRHSVPPNRFSRYAPAASAVVCAGIMVVGFAELGGASVAPTVKTGGSSGCYTHTSTGGTTATTALNPQLLAAARSGKAKTVTVTKTVTKTKTLWKTKTIVKCGTKTVTATGPGSTTTVYQTSPGETTTVTTTVGAGPTVVLTRTVTETGTTTETVTTTVGSTGTTTETTTVTTTLTLTPLG